MSRKYYRAEQAKNADNAIRDLSDTLGRTLEEMRAKAAEAAGDMKKAATYMRSLAQLTRNADSDRTEIREARQQLASR